MQLAHIKEYLLEAERKEIVEIDTELLIPSEVVSLMKLGYVLANIAVNIQKNGLCVKEEKEDNEESGSEHIADGMGIGEGEVHEGAENVGDEIEFEEQVMGHKDEEKNENNNAGNKEENDIEMENEFDGEMFSKEEEEGQDEGESKEADEKMGDVDEKEKEQDMKNEAGEAEGS